MSSLDFFQIIEDFLTAEVEKVCKEAGKKNPQMVVSILKSRLKRPAPAQRDDHRVSLSRPTLHRSDARATLNADFKEIKKYLSA